jgi:cytochrome c nitrite reductase small subunit
MNLRRIEVLVLGTAIGLAVGIAGYTFVYARGDSYLTNDPAACANCHIMREYYDGWIRSSHRAVAVCNDCHTPSGFIAKYAAKASNGFWHSVAFTSGRFPEPVQIKPHNREIAEEACRACHQDVVVAIDTFPHPGEKLSCVQCHRAVGHVQ